MPTTSEIHFIKMWQELSAAGSITSTAANRHPHWSHACGRVDFAVWPEAAGKGQLVGEFVLNPRGADLIATAEHVGPAALVADDVAPAPQAAEPERVTCPECDGEGRVPVTFGGVGPTREAAEARIQVWDMGCTGCGGRGTVPRVSNHTWVIDKEGDIQTTPLQWHDEDDDWTRGCEAITEVLRTARATGKHVECLWHASRHFTHVGGKVCSYDSGDALMPFLIEGKGVTPRVWCAIEGNGYVGSAPVIRAVRLVSSAPNARQAIDDTLDATHGAWATYADEIRTFLQTCIEDAAELDVRWQGGEALDISDVHACHNVFSECATFYTARHILGFGYPGHTPSPTEPVLTAVRRKI